MVKYSIIIPVFNSEKTLYRCIDSILKQTYTNWELLLIDDGSSDSSFTICSNYSQRDIRIKVLHQENSGPSVARNLGLNHASGEWICFVDSDDFISRNYLEELENIIGNYQNLEIIFFGFNNLESDKNITKMIIPKDNCYKGIKLAAYLSLQGVFGFTWIKVFKKDKIGKIRFRKDLDLFEDEVFTCEVIEECREIYVLKKALYNYVCVEDSLMRRTNNDFCRKCEEVYLAWKKLLTAQNEWKEYGEYLDNRANFFVSRCKYYGMERNVYIKSYFSELKDTSFFKEHKSLNDLDQLIIDDKYVWIWVKRMGYRIKTRIYSLIKRRMKK